jgi:hypothetical protein
MGSDPIGSDRLRIGIVSTSIVGSGNSLHPHGYPMDEGSGYQNPPKTVPILVKKKILKKKKKKILKQKKKL